MVCSVETDGGRGTRFAEDFKGRLKELRGTSRAGRKAFWGRTGALTDMPALFQYFPTKNAGV